MFSSPPITIIAYRRKNVYSRRIYKYFPMNYNLRKRFDITVYMCACVISKIRQLKPQLYNKNIERYTSHTIVSWPNPKQWVIVHTLDLMMMIRQNLDILSIIKREMGKLKTHSPTYCIMDNWEKMLNLAHTPDKIYRIMISTLQRVRNSVQ